MHAGCECSRVPVCRVCCAVCCAAGRAGLAGEAVTFFTEADAPRLRSIAHLVKEAGSDVPDWMLHLARQRKARRQQVGGEPS